MFLNMHFVWALEKHDILYIQDNENYYVIDKINVMNLEWSQVHGSETHSKHSSAMLGG